ncbi:RNA polymerase subunit sigma-70 [Nocardia crassostreae]|uniref:RNA polymerase subunit sigma-70 n=1 Tax=Nocardia crassostreae TaxID=53428 RepID=UPI00082DCCCE|nr:RNA polymerase subunit sigma-70 [Nocardia crassostreae]
MPSTAEFTSRTEPFRPELLAHCYRILGSIHDAEDLVQETYVRAWGAFDRFEGRSSIRTWLYKIATNVCLTALETRTRRPLPSGLGAPQDDHRVALADHDPTIPWLQPAPDLMFTSDDPATGVSAKSGVRLAFIAALQLLPARQRAVLTLRDVLSFRTAEVATMLDMTPAAVDSALRRARTRLSDVAPVADDLSEPDEQSQRHLIDSYVEAFARADAQTLATLLRADVELEMPPIPTWFTGRDAVIAFFSARVMRPNEWRMLPTTANTQPAVIIYKRTTDSHFTPYGIQVFTLIGPRIA